MDRQTRELLPPMDQVSFRSYIRICLCFPLLEDFDEGAVLRRLAAALQDVVATHPFMGAKLGIDSMSGKISIEHQPKPQINFTRQTSMMLLSYSQFKDRGFAPEFFTGPHLLESTYPTEASADVAQVKYSFIDGGLLLWVYLHHAIADGSCLDMFLHQFAFSTQRCSSRYVKPFNITIHPPFKIVETIGALGGDVSPRTSLKDCPEYAEIEEGGVYGTAIVAEPSPHAFDINGSIIFTFQTRRLRELAFVMQREANFPETPSLYVCLAALAWTQTTRARLVCDTSTTKTSDGMSISKLMIPVNWRKRAFQNTTDSFFGNTTVLPIVTLPIRHLLRACDGQKAFSDVISTIQGAINAVDEAFVTQRLKMMNVVDPRSIRVNFNPENGYDLSVNAWRFFGADTEWNIPGFSSTKPDAIRRVQGNSSAGNVLILPARQSSHVLEVMVTLRKNALDELSRSRGWAMWMSD